MTQWPTQDDPKVVNFYIAVSEHYRSKKGGERVATPLVSIIPTGKARQSQVESREFAMSIKKPGTDLAPLSSNTRALSHPVCGSGK